MASYQKEEDLRMLEAVLNHLVETEAEKNLISDLHSYIQKLKEKNARTVELRKIYDKEHRDRVRAKNAEAVKRYREKKRMEKAQQAQEKQ